MLSVRACKMLIPAVALISALTAVPAIASRTHRNATAAQSKSAKKKTASHQLHGQRQIEPERAREIQSALIREHYLTGEPSGQWDAESQAAMTKFQADQGWQTKLTPDSRALIKLGLGPNQESSPQLGNQAALPSSLAPTQNTTGVRSNSLTASQSVAR
jgi:hypothetical protein